MIKYEHDKGMMLCIFYDVEDEHFTCDECDLRQNGTCTPEFQRKHGYRRNTLDIYFRRRNE